MNFVYGAIHGRYREGFADHQSPNCLLETIASSDGRFYSLLPYVLTMPV